MFKTNLYLALAAALVLAPVAAQARDSFVARMLTSPDGAGRWVNRRLTIRHHDQDTPWKAKAVRHEDSFVARALTAPHDEGRWLNRRLTLRHRGQDAPQAARIG